VTKLPNRPIVFADPFSPKGIAKRIKQKGLQKLRWYCQMCEKQCRDENGFKCHLTSESHRRQMEILGQNPQHVVKEFTEQFESTFLEHLRRSHPFSRVSANVVYNEYIQDRHHVHMNSTKWLTLTEFVKYLGREGKCKVEDTPKGWYITLIQKDPFEGLEGQKREKRDRSEQEEEDRHRKALEVQAERARKLARVDVRGKEDGSAVGVEGTEAAHELHPEALQVPLGFKLGSSRIDAAGPTTTAQNGHHARPSIAAAAATEFEDADPGAVGAATMANPARKKSKVEQIMEKDIRAKAAQNASNVQQTALAGGSAENHGAASMEIRTDKPWLAENIVVKVMSKALREHGYYKQKGVVVRVVDGFIGEVEMQGSGDIVRVDQEELETVIPSPGGAVLVVSGALRGVHGILERIDEANYKAEVRLKDPRSGEKGKVWLYYEEFCKLASKR
jgi:DNA/RNA-binding protein KIN17